MEQSRAERSRDRTEKRAIEDEIIEWGRTEGGQEGRKTERREVGDGHGGGIKRKGAPPPPLPARE